MSTSVEWIVEDRILLYTNDDSLSLEELHEASVKLANYIKDGDAPVHVIINTHQLKKYPIDITALRKAVVFFLEPKLGWVVHASSNHQIQFLATAVAKIVGVNLQNVKTYEDAVAFLKEIDDSLGDVPIPDHLP